MAEKEIVDYMVPSAAMRLRTVNMETDRIYFSHLDEVLLLVGKAHFNLFKGHPFLIERNSYLNRYL